MATEPRILQSTKKILGIGLDDASFDPDIISHINSALSNLSQLGIAPPGGISVTEENELTWEDIGIGSMGFDENTSPIYGQIQTLIYLRVRLLFDPPATSYHLAALERQIQEHEWRINTMREATGWVDPDPQPPVEPFETVIEGGGAG